MFDFIWFKVCQSLAIEVEKSWRALNKKLESEGKERWDGKKKKQDKNKVLLNFGIDFKHLI